MRPTVTCVSLSLALTLTLSSCHSGGFDDGAVRSILESQPVTLSNAQVLLTQQQADCGVENDLWYTPHQAGERNVAQLGPKGKDLKFSDDVSMSDPEFRQPYTQINGSVQLAVADVSNIRDADNGMKLADVKVGVKVSHSCFADPLPLMGVRKGRFAADAQPIFRFRQDGDKWVFDKIVH